MHLAIFTGGGIGWALTNVSVSLASGLVRQGHVVDLVVLNETDEALKRFYGDIRGFGDVHIFTLGVPNTHSSFFRLIRYLRSRNPDILFSQLSISNIFAFLAKKFTRIKIKNIFLEGTIISKIDSLHSQKNIRLRIIPPLVRLIYPLTDAVICKSPDVLDDLRKMLCKKRLKAQLEFLPNPYPLDRFRLLSEEQVELPWKDDSDIPIIISIGRLASEKAFDILIKAFFGVRRIMKCRLLILGEGPQRYSLQNLIDKLGLTSDAIMPGAQKNPWKFMARAHIFVLASRWEGWPSALTEAMSLGLPVITTDCPGGGKVMVERGVNGLVVSVDDIGELTEAMLLLLRDNTLRLQLAREAFREAEKYDYFRVAGDYARVAEEVLTRG